MTCLKMDTPQPDSSIEFTITPGLISWAIINSLLFVCILTGNTLTFLAVRMCRRLRAIISNLFILSLAISDIIVGLSLPYHLAFYVAPTALGQHKPTCLLRFFLIIFACSVSVFTLITIAIDRYVAIVFPYQYCCRMTRKTAYCVIIFNWLAGAAVASIPMFFNHWSENCECEFYVILPAWYVVGIITPGFLIIWAAMFVLYWRILREALRCSHNIKHITYNNNDKHSNKKHGSKSSAHSSDWKSVQIVILIMGCFSVCWLPYFIVTCDQIFNLNTYSSALYRSALSLAIANSCMNPLIYAWKNTNFRRGFRLLIHCQTPNSYVDSITCNIESLHKKHKHPQKQEQQKQQEKNAAKSIGKIRRPTQVQIVTISHRHLNSVGAPMPLQFETRNEEETAPANVTQYRALQEEVSTSTPNVPEITH